MRMEGRGKRPKYFMDMDPDLIQQELCYGTIMALTFIFGNQFGLMSMGRNELIIAIIGMDAVWGIIDLILFFRSDMTGLARRGALSVDLHKDSKGDVGELRGRVHDEFQGTFLDMVDKKTREEVIDRIMLSGPVEDPNALADKWKRNYRKSAIGSCIVATFPALPPAICLLVISDFDTALTASAIALSLILFNVGYMISPCRKTWVRILSGLAVVALTLTLTVFAALFGG
ncbi:MAG: hypothetical protein E7Z69_04705 [Thermoplasmata archaeon]|nr:hypothetical protein [Thermoplasmata archaeon]